MEVAGEEMRVAREKRDVLGRGRVVLDDAKGVMVRARRVHNEGRKVEPRRSERRYHVPSVGAGARGVMNEGAPV